MAQIFHVFRCNSWHIGGGECLAGDWAVEQSLMTSYLLYRMQCLQCFGTSKNTLAILIRPDGGRVCVSIMQAYVTGDRQAGSH